MYIRSLFIWTAFAVACQVPPTMPSVSAAPTPALVAPGVATSQATQTLSQDTARTKLESLAATVRGCFPQEARWSLSVWLIVEPTGLVSAAKTFDLMQGSDAAKCVEAALLATRFAPFEGGALRLSYVFSLGPLIEPADAVVVPIPAQSDTLSLSKSQPTSQAQSTSQNQPTEQPKEASAALLQAERLFALGDLDGAGLALAPFKEKPLPEMLYLLGGIAQQRGKVAEMCDYYRRYLEASPKSPAAPGLQKQVAAVCAR